MGLRLAPGLLRFREALKARSRRIAFSVLRGARLIFRETIRFRTLYAALGGVIIWLSVRPLVRLYAEFPDHADSYWKLYPGLFLCALPASCCLAFMFRPIQAVLREFPTSATVRVLSLALA